MITVSVGKHSVSTFARLMALSTLEADTHMLGLYVLVKDIDRARKGAFSAPPSCLSLHHPGPDQTV